MQTTFDPGSGGWHHATCPSCGKVFTWSTAAEATKKLTCNAEQGRNEKRCSHTMRKHDWEYLKYQEERDAQSG
jgi:hypothetical protein